MRKVLGFGLALVLMLPLSAAADGIKGKVLWVSDGQLADLTPGEPVQAMYEMQGGKRMVTDLDHRTVGSDGQETSNFFSRQPSPIDLMQSGY